jgi:flagellar hook-basal body protein
MSLYGALYSGVSGLSSQSSAMGAISDNIANVNTIGYKGTTVNFQTLITQQTSLTQYSPGGVQSKPRAGIDVQGLLQATSSSTDVALSGSGFFVVNSTATPASEGGTFSYTRAGSFKSDQYGYLENAAGFYLQGWPLTPTDNSVSAVPGQVTVNGTTYMKAYKNSDGTYHYINQNIVSPEELQSLNTQTIGGTAQATSSLEMGANLPSGDPVYDSSHPENGGIHDTNVQLYDSLGNSGNAQFTWTKTGANAWQLAVTPPSGAATAVVTNHSDANQTLYGKTDMVYAAQGQLEFNSVPPAGSYFTMSSIVPGATTPSYVQIQFYNSATSGIDPTADNSTLGTSANPYVLGVNLNGVTNTQELATTLQSAIQTAANEPSARNTYGMSAIFTSDQANGADRFTADSNVLRIIQEPGAAAVNVNCIANTTTGLGDSIVESGAGIGSGSNSTTPISTGQFTIPTIDSPTATPWVSELSTQQTGNVTINAVNAGTYSGNSNTFTFNTVPTTGALYIGGTKIGDWSTIMTGAGATTPATAAVAAQAAITAANIPGLTATVNAAGTGVYVTTSNAANTDAAIIAVTPDAPDANGKVTASDITWSNGAAGTGTQTAPPSPDVLQIGSINVPWAEIVAGTVSDYYDSSTGAYVALTTPVQLTYGANGSQVAGGGNPGTGTGGAMQATDLAANIAQLLNPASTAANPVGLWGQPGTTDDAALAAVTVTNPGLTAISQDASNAAQLDLTMAAGNAAGGPNTLFINNSDVTWANGVTGNQNPVILGKIGSYTSAGAAVTFNGDGTPASILPNAMQLTWANGAENQVGTTGSATIKPQVSIDLGSLNQSNGLTQLGGDYAVTYMTQNGAKFGNFTGISIGTDGIVTALFDNGVRSPVFQIPIATFANPDGMQSETGNVWISTSLSGAYTLRSPGEAGSGTVQESSLESSTVDIGTEFTNMITVQNAYSAAAKIITTTDQMLTDLINIKQ